MDAASFSVQVGLNSWCKFFGADWFKLLIDVREIWLEKCAEIVVLY